MLSSVNILTVLEQNADSTYCKTLMLEMAVTTISPKCNLNCVFSIRDRAFPTHLCLLSKNKAAGTASVRCFLLCMQCKWASYKFKLDFLNKKQVALLFLKTSN